jgi:uncharacterized protein HemY
METSPNIPDKIIKSFKYEFKKYDGNTLLPKIITPEICDTLESTELSRNRWSSEENKNKKINQILSKEKEYLEVILNFKNTFFEINNREPLDSEIFDNLKEKIDNNILCKYLGQIKLNKTPEQYKHTSSLLNFTPLDI